MSSQFSPKTEEIYQSDNSEGKFGRKNAKSKKKRIKGGAIRLSMVPTKTLIKRRGELIRDIDFYDASLQKSYYSSGGDSYRLERARSIDELRTILNELARREKLAMERKKKKEFSPSSQSTESVGQEILGNREEDDDWSRWLI